MGQKLFSKCHSEFLIDVMIEIRKIVQFNSNEHDGFQKQLSNKVLQNSFFKINLLIHMETTEIYNSNKTRHQC